MGRRNLLFFRHDYHGFDGVRLNLLEEMRVEPFGGWTYQELRLKFGVLFTFGPLWDVAHAAYMSEINTDLDFYITDPTVFISRRASRALKMAAAAVWAEADAAREAADDMLDAHQAVIEAAAVVPAVMVEAVGDSNRVLNGAVGLVARVDQHVGVNDAVGSHEEGAVGVVAAAALIGVGAVAIIADNVPVWNVNSTSGSECGDVVVLGGARDVSLISSVVDERVRSVVPIVGLESADDSSESDVVVLGRAPSASVQAAMAFEPIEDVAPVERLRLPSESDCGTSDVEWL